MASSCSSKLPLLFSTDLTGIFAKKPELFYQLFQTISADCRQLAGLEFVPFRFSHRRVSQKLLEYNLPIVGLHGPPAWRIPTCSVKGNLIASIFASITPSLNTCLELNQSLKPKYFLIHELDLDQPLLRKKLISHFQNWSKNQLHSTKPIFMIENVYRQKSWQQTVKKINQLHQQTRTGLMLDLAHLLHQVTGLTKPFTHYEQLLNPDNIDHYWQKLLTESHQALNQVSLAAIHLPLGETSDGLPFDLIKAKHWQNLAGLIKHHQNKLLFLVIENQHAQTRLSLTEKYLPTLIKDKKRKLKTLLKAGVI